MRVFQRLSDRLAGKPPEEVLHEGVPDWLQVPMRQWLYTALQKPTGFARRVAVRLRIPMGHGAPEEDVLFMVNIEVDQLLDAVDATLQIHPAWENRHPAMFDPYETWTQPEWRSALVDLGELLLEGGSLYKVNVENRCLERRVSHEVEAAFKNAAQDAPSAAADHMRQAWKSAYGLSPDPDKVFSESIRAVEELACPLVLSRKAESGNATLGGVIGELKNNSGHRWRLLMPAKDGSAQDPTAMVGLMESLWNAQRSRHGGGPNSRRMTQQEAEAAVHLTVLLVRWLSTGVLTKT